MVGRDLWRSRGPTLPLEGMPLVSTLGLCPDSFWILPNIESTNSLGKLCQCLVTCREKKMFPMFIWNFLYLSFYPLSLAVNHWKQLGSVAFALFLLVYTHMDKIPHLKPSPGRIVQLSQPLLIGEMLQYFHYLHWTVSSMLILLLYWKESNVPCSHLFKFRSNGGWNADEQISLKARQSVCPQHKVAYKREEHWEKKMWSVKPSCSN